MKHIKTHRALKIILPLLILTSLWGCERDDICSSETPTTPHLVIHFYNVNARNETKTVRHLSVHTENHPNYIIHDRTIDKIMLPLKIEAMDNLNTTRFVLTKDTDYLTDENPTTVANVDIIEVFYTPELIYVSRACGYKSVFNDLITTRETDDDNWIIDFEVINTTVNDENAAHINIYH